MKRNRPIFSKKQIIIGGFTSLLVVVSLCVWFMPTLRQEMQTIKYQAYLWGHSTIDRMIRMGGFTVENINISGLKYTSKIDILNVLNVNYGDNILWVDTQTLLESLKKIGWIEHVTIQKKFPNTIEIFIREYRPYALWQYKNHINVITETGVIIPKADPKHFADLSLVVGEKANLQCKSLFSILTDYPEFKDMIVSAQYVHGRRWRLHFSTNIIVDLPEDNISDTIHKVYTLHQKQKILDRDVEIIDMRIPNKLVFKGSKNLKRTKNLTQQGV